MAAHRPLTGIGLGNFASMYYSFTDYWHGKPRATHNMWLEVLAESGAIAFVLFVAMVVSSFKINLNSFRRLREAHAPQSLLLTTVALQAALMGTSASGTFLSQAQTWPVYVIVALIAGMSCLARNLQPARPDTAVVGERDGSYPLPDASAPIAPSIRSG
jgi:O-antigen ligase